MDRFVTEKILIKILTISICNLSNFQFRCKMSRIVEGKLILFCKFVQAQDSTSILNSSAVRYKLYRNP